MKTRAKRSGKSLLFIRDDDRYIIRIYGWYCVGMALLLETLYGDLVIDLDVEGSPELCKNVIKLAYCRYYTNTLIFNVTAQRFCQLGCPAGDGTGGVCIYGLIDAAKEQQLNPNFDCKLSKYRFMKSFGRTLTSLECQEKGRVVATLMNFIPDTIGSQLLITTTGGPDHALDGYRHNTGGSAVGTSDSANEGQTQFLSLGKVTEDKNNVLDKINAAYTDPDGRPYADVRIIRALVIYDPFVNEVLPGIDLLLRRRGVVVDDTSTSPSSSIVDTTNRRVIASPSPDRPSEEIVSKRISAADITMDDDNEDMYMDDEKYEQERIRQRRVDEEETAKKVDQSRAAVLEMIGDLPDANIRAPENVLFICKLNPITIDDDLELIFSRFDEQVKVEIIRDMDTGNSLQYAFAEFTTEQAAAEAYFKMNNALIDDRRIKVDFSQSVAKLWDRYHQKMKMPNYQNYATDQKHQRGRNGNDMKSTTCGQNESAKFQSGGGDRPADKGFGRNRDSSNYSNRRNESNDHGYAQRSEDDRHRKRDQYGDKRWREETDNRKLDRTNDNDDTKYDRKRGRHYENSEKYDDRGSSDIRYLNESYRRSRQSDDTQENNDESDDERRRHRSRHIADHSHGHGQDAHSDDVHRRHGKKSHRSRDDDSAESDRHHRRHHKHKKKHYRENNRDGSTEKHHRRSRSENR